MDNGAIEVLPRVQALIDASDASHRAFLVKISNPTLGAVCLRLTPSNDAGESLQNGRTESDLCELKPALGECTVSLCNLESGTKPQPIATPTNGMT